MLRQHFPHETHEQLMEMCRMMDINKDGLVDLNEFLEAFRLCEFTKESLKSSALAKEPPKVDHAGATTNGQLAKKPSVDQPVVRSNGAPTATFEDSDEDVEDDGSDADVVENCVGKSANGNAKSKVPKNKSGSRSKKLVKISLDGDGKSADSNENASAQQQKSTDVCI